MFDLSETKVFSKNRELCLQPIDSVLFKQTEPTAAAGILSQPLQLIDTDKPPQCLKIDFEDNLSVFFLVHYSL